MHAYAGSGRANALTNRPRPSLPGIPDPLTPCRPTTSANGRPREGACGSVRCEALIDQIKAQRVAGPGDNRTWLPRPNTRLNARPGRVARHNDMMRYLKPSRSQQTRDKVSETFA
jgi:hypothetical protein